MSVMPRKAKDLSIQSSYSTENPASCHRCAGLILRDGDERRCGNCGWQLNEPVAPPIVANINRQWTPGICEFCGQSAQRGKPLCLGCRRKELAVEISEGRRTV